MGNASSRQATLKGILTRVRALRKDWQRTFAGLQKKQRAILKRLVSQEESKRLSSLRRSLS